MAVADGTEQAAVADVGIDADAVAEVGDGAGGAFGDEGGRTIQQAWPIILVVIGAWLFLRDRVSV